MRLIRCRTQQGLRGGRARRRLVAVLCVLALLGHAAPVSADPQPAIGPANVAVLEPVALGGEARMPSLTVMNHGDVAGAFVMSVIIVRDEERLAADPSWFTFEPQRMVIAPGGASDVRVLLRVPADAEEGVYRVLLVTHTEGSSFAEGGAAIRAGVATTLDFTVKDLSPGFFDPAVDWFQDRSPFSYIGVGLLVGLAAVQVLRMQFDFSFEVRRRE